MVMFYDTNPAVQDEGNGIEVPRFWEETKGGYRRLEFGSEAESGSPGIGVLWMRWEVRRLPPRAIRGVYHDDRARGAVAQSLARGAEDEQPVDEP